MRQSISPRSIAVSTASRYRARDSSVISRHGSGGPLYFGGLRPDLPATPATYSALVSREFFGPTTRNNYANGHMTQKPRLHRNQRNAMVWLGYFLYCSTWPALLTRVRRLARIGVARHVSARTERQERHGETRPGRDRMGRARRVLARHGTAGAELESAILRFRAAQNRRFSCFYPPGGTNPQRRVTI